MTFGQSHLAYTIMPVSILLFLKQNMNTPQIAMYSNSIRFSCFSLGCIAVSSVTVDHFQESSKACSQCVDLFTVLEGQCVTRLSHLDLPNKINVMTSNSNYKVHSQISHGDKGPHLQNDQKTERCLYTHTHAKLCI